MDKKLDDQYTRTLYEIAVSYGQNGIFKLREEDISTLADMLQLDSQKLVAALSSDDKRPPTFFADSDFPA